MLTLFGLIITVGLLNRKRNKFSSVQTQ